MTTRLRLFPLNAVLFPGAVLNLHVFEPRYKQLIQECMDSGEAFGVALIAEGAEAGDPNVLPHDVGSTAEIVEVTPLPFGRCYVSTIGRERFRIRKVVSREPYLLVEADVIEEPAIDETRSAETGERARSLFDEYVALLVEFSGHTTQRELPADACHASYAIGDALQVGDTLKQRLLEIDDVAGRLDMECAFLERVLPQLRKLLERRRVELHARRERGEDVSYRAGQEKFFGKFFSAN